MTRSAPARAALAALLIAVAGPAWGDHGATPVQPLARAASLDPADPITVSGLSSGGFFAHQFHVAFSGMVNGAGIVAGGPYACAREEARIRGWPWSLGRRPMTRVEVATATCTHAGRVVLGAWEFVGAPTAPKAGLAWPAARDAFARGRIDDPVNLADDRAWLFAGADDPLVPRGTTDALEAFYRQAGLPAGEALAARTERRAGHGMPVDGDATPCARPDDAFMMRCDFDASGLLLGHLLGALRRPVDATGPKGGLTAFPQADFFDTGDERASLGPLGYLYVPPSCRADAPTPARCRLHVAFHGCRQAADQPVGGVHGAFLRGARYNLYADAYDLVVLYPQVQAWGAGLDRNPRGCWDWWGYTGEDFDTRTGTQMRAVKAMVDRLTGR